MKAGDIMGSFWQYLIIIIILIIIAVSILKSKQQDFKMEANKLVEYLGGKENIISYEVNKSRFIVTLNDIKIVNKEGIQKIGAQGIVEIDNQLKIILGEQASKIEKYIKELK
ncbi:MAG: PTS transporter subunit EIIB [Bacilli bacterium]